MTARASRPPPRDNNEVIVRLTDLADGEGIRTAVLKSQSTEWKYKATGSQYIFHVGGFVDERQISSASFVCDELEPAGSGSSWRLRAMATLPDYQGKGVGTKVLAFGMSEVARRGGKLIWCEGRTSARRFYEHIGFHALGREFDNPGTGRHVIFARALSNVEYGSNA